MIKKIFNVLLILAFAYVSYSFYKANGSDRANVLHSYYQENAIQEFGAQNVVASIVVSYRGLDTLGEVTILFLSALLIAFMMSFKEKKKENILPLKESSEILETATFFLMPFIFILGLYIIINGHLTPGGGFQGGSVLATGLILLIITNVNYKVRTVVLKYIESLSGVSYILLAILGAVFGLGLLDPKLLPIGTVGKIMSAGLIPVIYILIGMKVGAELSVIFYNLKKED